MSAYKLKYGKYIHQWARHEQYNGLKSLIVGFRGFDVLRSTFSLLESTYFVTSCGFFSFFPPVCFLIPSAFCFRRTSGEREYGSRQSLDAFSGTSCEGIKKRTIPAHVIEVSREIVQMTRKMPRGSLLPRCSPTSLTRKPSVVEVLLKWQEEARWDLP